MILREAGPPSLGPEYTPAIIVADSRVTVRLQADAGCEKWNRRLRSEPMYVVDSIQNGFPGGLELVATSMIAEGDRVAIEVASNGTHANGRTCKNTDHFLITIEAGQMIEVKEYMDTLHLFQLIQP